MEYNRIRLCSGDTVGFVIFEGEDERELEVLLADWIESRQLTGPGKLTVMDRATPEYLRDLGIAREVAVGTLKVPEPRHTQMLRLWELARKHFPQDVTEVRSS